MVHIVRFDGDRLRALRTARKWDQHRLAEAARTHGVGITQSQVSRYENGQEPAARNAMALAAALQVDVADFFANGSEAQADQDDDEESDPMVDLIKAIRRVVQDELANSATPISRQPSAALYERGNL